MFRITGIGVEAALSFSKAKVFRLELFSTLASSSSYHVVILSLSGFQKSSNTVTPKLKIYQQKAPSPKLPWSFPGTPPRPGIELKGMVWVGSAIITPDPKGAPTWVPKALFGYQCNPKLPKPEDHGKKSPGTPGRNRYHRVRTMETGVTPRLLVLIISFIGPLETCFLCMNCPYIS